jgi:3-dehydroquinate dehydratase/shikimate dehydrogenase
MDPLSQKIGAVNTVTRFEGKLYGMNTDVAGIVVPLQKRIEIKGAKILVLGAGGSARAAVFALRDKGAEVFILNRTPETAAKLARQSGAKVLKPEALAKSAFDVILNATPVGMAGNSAKPILTAADFDKGLKAKLVFDLVYNPIDTPLIRLARQQNIPIITGIEMFVQQGVRQFEIWTGKPAPEEEMLRVVLHALKQQAS